MRKLTPVLVAACLLQALSGHAQSAWLGFNGGVSIHNLRDGGNPMGENFISRRGATFGLMSEFRQRKNLSLLVELYYSGQGGTRDGLQPVSSYPLPPGAVPPGYPYFYADIHKEITFDCIHLPIMARFSWGTKFQFYVNAGFFLGYLFHADYRQNGTSQFYFDSKGQQPLVLLGGDSPGRVNFEDDLKISSALNAGVTGGAGIAVRLDTGNKIFFDARYEYGSSGVGEYNNKTTNVLFSLGYAWRL
jgi:hypothetical protein